MKIYKNTKKINKDNPDNKLLEKQLEKIAAGKIKYPEQREVN